MGNRELARTYCNLNLTEAREEHYNKLYYFAYNGLGNYFVQTNQKDSAACYYSLSLQYAKNSTGIGQYIKLSLWLYNYYKTRREEDSAVKYVDLYLPATDSIANLKKAIQVQNIAFEEDLRH